jgi:hypothetical protein
MKYPMITTAELQSSVAELQVVSKQTSEHTLQKHLNMPSHVATMKLLLINRIKAKRLKFNQAYQNVSVRTEIGHIVGCDDFQVHQGLQGQGEEARGGQQVLQKVHREDCHALGQSDV